MPLKEFVHRSTIWGIRLMNIMCIISIGKEEGILIDGSRARAETPLIPVAVASFDCALLEAALRT
jgi:hypothetical protein